MTARQFRVLSTGVVLLFAIAVTASAQSLVALNDVDTIRKYFDSSAPASALRCHLEAMLPELDYGLQFRTGYKLDVPRSQFEELVPDLHTYLRVTPRGLQPVYLENADHRTGAAQSVNDGEGTGKFVVGEGRYDVEVLVRDEQQRVCRAKWSIRPKRYGSESRLIPALPADTVSDLTTEGAARRVSEPTPGNGRLTIIIQAAPLIDPSSSKLSENDIQALTGSLTTLLRQLTAKSVRLIVFNLDQRSVVLREDDFTAQDLDKLTTVLKDVDLLVVDIHTLQQKPGDLIADLVQGAVRNAGPEDAVILLGPASFHYMEEETPTPGRDFLAAVRPSLIYLEYDLTVEPPRGRNIRLSRQIILMNPVASSNNIEKLFDRLKGKTIPIHTPDDLADAVRRIQEEMAKRPR
jgi:hypothetical protein